MANRLALQDLQTFNRNPTSHNASRLVTIPVVYNLLMQEEKDHRHYRTSVTKLCTWIYKRGIDVLEKLLVHGTPPDIELPYKEIDWRTVGSLRTSQLEYIG